LHDNCVYQQDVHLNNFLIRDGAIFLIDGDQVLFKAEPPALALKKAVDNLALFFTQLYPWEDEKIEPLFNYYCSLRLSVSDEISLRAVRKQLQKRRLWRERKFLEKKIFRVCSDFNMIKNWKHYCLFSREIGVEAASNFMSDPDRFIDEGEILKSGRSATVAKICFAGKAYAVKRYNKKSNYHRLARSLKESRAAVSWRNGHLLRFNGLPTAKPILMLEQRLGKMRFGSYIITEYIPGEHAANYFSRDDQSDEAKMIAEEVAGLVGKLHKSGISHGDLKSHNIWIAENRPILIDLDGMRRNKYEIQHERLVKEDWLRLHRDLGSSGVASRLFSEGKGLYV
jgi:tRNA A-37 threonylcarbamoyl transferase component Bud32